MATGDVKVIEVVRTADVRVIEVRIPGIQGPPGPPGIPGPSGSGGGSSAFVYDRPVAASSWPITHNLGRRPIVTLYGTGGEIIEADVSADSTTALVVFPFPVAGSAVLI